MRPTVLIVDDYLPARRLLRLMLEPQVRCVEASSTREAARILSSRRARQIDLVLLELGMPRQAGASWLLELWRSEATTPVIAMSTSPDEALADWALRAGAAAHLRKPFCEHDLHAVLAAVFGRQSASQNAASPAA